MIANDGQVFLCSSWCLQSSAAVVPYMIKSKLADGFLFTLLDSTVIIYEWVELFTLYREAQYLLVGSLGGSTDKTSFIRRIDNETTNQLPIIPDERSRHHASTKASGGS